MQGNLKLTVAAITVATVDGLLDANYRRAERLVEIALAASPDLVLLPEAFAGGYCATDLRPFAERRDSRRLRRFRDLSRAGSCLIALGFLERARDGIRNAVVLFDQGAEIGVHHKRTLWPDAARPYRDEHALMVPGARADVFTTRFGRCAVFTCYENMVDGEWAEAAPFADFALSPYNCEDDPSRHNVAQSRRHGIPSVWANRTGTVFAGDGYRPNPGTAGLVDAGGQILARSEPGVETIVVGHLSLAVHATPLPLHRLPVPELCHLQAWEKKA